MAACRGLWAFGQHQKWKLEQEQIKNHYVAEVKKKEIKIMCIVGVTKEDINNAVNSKCWRKNEKRAT